MFRLLALTVTIFLINVPVVEAACECPEPTIESSEKLLASGMVIADVKVEKIQHDGTFVMKMLSFYSPPSDDIAPQGLLRLDQNEIACVKEGEIRDFALSCGYSYSSIPSCKIENICSRLHPDIRKKTNSVDAVLHLVHMCNDKGGRYIGKTNGWGIYYGCDLPSGDGGKKCYSKKDCEGFCLQKTGERRTFLEKIEKTILRRESGKCQPYKSNRYAPHDIIENGKRRKQYGVD